MASVWTNIRSNGKKKRAGRFYCFESAKKATLFIVELIVQDIQKIICDNSDK